mgnify:CR=1 FL=1
MANPLTAALGYLRGDDLKARVPQTPPLTPKGMGRKLWYYNDWGIGVALRMGTLVHGPGATELLGQAFGNYGQDANSAVFACLAYIGRKFPSAPLRVWRRDPEGGEPDVVPDHPLEELVARPNGHMTGKELWYWTQWAKHTSGNA